MVRATSQQRREQMIRPAVGRVMGDHVRSVKDGVSAGCWAMLVWYAEMRCGLIRAEFRRLCGCAKCRRKG